MAPVKRSTTEAQRAVRTTRAAAVASKKTSTSDKKPDSLGANQQSSIATKAASSTRGRKQVVPANTSEGEDVQHSSITNTVEGEPTRSSKSRTTRSTAPLLRLAAAPRRRLKVTPLNSSASTSSTVQASTAEIASTESVKTGSKQEPKQKRTTRSNSATNQLDNDGSDDARDAKSTMKSTAKTAHKASENKRELDLHPIVKARGRPKNKPTVEKQETTTAKSEETLPHRSTRSRRVVSDAYEASMPIENTQGSRTTKGLRKKVTFQDIQDENEKENAPLQRPRAKVAVANNSTEPVKAAGMRARPIRKSAAQNTTTRSLRPAGKAIQTTESNSHKQETEVGNSKKLRALTPKKITQLAKSSSPDHEEVDPSEGEDELNGGKTPIRDLSVSPRRPTTVALLRAFSPSKKLDFTQSLVQNSPKKTAVHCNLDTDSLSMLASPARRPAASPFKDSLKSSPRRGLHEATKALFPQHETTSSITFNIAADNQPIHSMSTILQSPKRVGVLDPSFFSQSAIKKQRIRSPLKASLFGSPAKRLFSPAKKESTPLEEKLIQPYPNNYAEQTNDETEMQDEVSATSHFKSSSCTPRVMRFEHNAVDLDFDDSIMQVRGPLKIHHSPAETLTQPHINPTLNLERIPLFLNPTEPTQTAENVKTAPLIISSEDIADHSGDATAHDVTTIESHNDPAEPVSEAKASLDTDQERSNPLFQVNGSCRPSLAQVLFRSGRNCDTDDSSEDELAGDATPVKPYYRNIGSRSRLSTGIPTGVTGKDFGFTPLANQISGWLASSPNKSPEQQQRPSRKSPPIAFSPLACQHIDGEVIISRDSTPVERLNKRSSAQASPWSRSSKGTRKPLDFRRSLAQRQSQGMVSSTESPVRNAHFDECMEIRALEEEAVMMMDGERNIVLDMHDQHGNFLEDEDEEEDYDSENSSEPTENFTTDLIKYTNASDTAIVDFQKLAEEANELASDGVQDDQLANSDLTDENLVATATVHPEEYSKSSEITSPMLVSPAVGLEAQRYDQDEVVETSLQSLMLRPIHGYMESPSVLDIDRKTLDSIGSTSVTPSSPPTQALSTHITTPKLNLKINERRAINTVVSKVPLKPEGLVSPIKMPRKRSRSIGNCDSRLAKRISLDDLKNLPVNSSNRILQSPDRRTRTSAAPSPGGTSTPAVRRPNMTHTSQMSADYWSAVTTPGQTSFAIDDFGDSTLDGIEMPDELEDELQLLQEIDQAESPSHSMYGKGLLSGTQTPEATLRATPNVARKCGDLAKTSTMIQRKHSQAARKSLAGVSINAADERTPLGPLGKGVLHGATIFVDVHTSEGADASGIFIELLTQMGAKCVREWRWNPHASLAHVNENAASELKVGITHVVFKDGSTRTLEKVRDAKVEVCCVGVAWVLDCERESKWLDESPYHIDIGILPRGGSKRRKSMEPRALLVSNDGAVSTTRSQRSFSTEMTKLTKNTFIDTPLRGQKPSNTSSLDDEDEIENDENIEQSTPTGYISYDPRSAMTPGTPYLVSQGKKLIQMSAPPKQLHKSLFDEEEEENEETTEEGEHGNAGTVKEAKKFKMKSLGDMAKRRRTLGFKPVIGSPLGRN